MLSSNSNLNAWRFFHKDSNSPDSFINMGFYFMISAALQRRVWVGSKEIPLFPNQFIILVADPAIGKGRVIGPLKKVLEAHKINRDTGKKETNIVTLLPEEMAAMQHESTYNEDSVKAKRRDPLLAIPLGADCTTFQKLVQKHSASTRTIPAPKSGFAPNGIYIHSSLCLVLPEMETFFPKKSEELVSYLTHCWDCESFDYETKHMGEDHLRNSCLNLIAGTTPAFMEKSLDAQLIAGGFSSRCIFVFEHSARSNSFKEFKISEEQAVALNQVTKHVGELTRLFGQVEYTPEAWEVLRHFFEEVDPYRRPNSSVKLKDYYGRKRVHAQKMAMAIHFAESTEMVIQKSSCEQALFMLEALEQKMHFALAYKGNSPLAASIKHIKSYLFSKGKASLHEIWQELEGSIDENLLTEALRYLVGTKEARVDDTIQTNKYWISLAWEKKQDQIKRTSLRELARQNGIELPEKKKAVGEG